MAIVHTYMSIITLKVNRFNYSIKRHKMAKWIKKQNKKKNHDPTICIQKIWLPTKDSP